MKKLLALMLALIVFFTVLISTIRSLGEADRSQRCLEINSSRSGEIDLNRGITYSFSRQWLFGNSPHTLSPNGLYDAFLYSYDPQYTAFSVHHLRSKINPPGHVLRTVSTDNLTLPPLWSWNSQWVIYTWNETDGTLHLSLNDPDHEHKTLTIPGISSAGIYNWGFSHDDRYLAITLQDSARQKEFVFIYSIPDFVLVNSIQLVDLITNAQLNGLVPQLFDVTDENLWSPIEDRLILMDNDQGRISILTLTPWAPVETIVSALPSQDYPYRVVWSPDGQYVLIEGNSYMGAVNLKSHQYFKISDSPVPVTDYMPLPFHWSPDGHTLVFLENRRGNSSPDLIAYDLDTLIAKVVIQQVDPSRISFLNNPHWLMIDQETPSGSWHTDLLDIRTWKILAQFVGDRSESPDGKTLVGVIDSSQANKVTLGWIHDDGRGVHEQTIDSQHGVVFVVDLRGVTYTDQWSRDSRYATFLNGNTMEILDTQTGLIQTIHLDLNEMDSYPIAHPSPDGQWMVVSYWSHDLGLIHMTLFANNGSQTHILYAHYVYPPPYNGTVVWSPDSHQIALEGQDSITLLGTDGQVIRTIAYADVGYASAPVWQTCR